MQALRGCSQGLGNRGAMRARERIIIGAFQSFQVHAYEHAPQIIIIIMEYSRLPELLQSLSHCMESEALLLPIHLADHDPLLAQL
jgi:hypothetical protein